MRNLVYKTSISQIVDREKLIVELERDFREKERERRETKQQQLFHSKLSKNFRVLVAVGFRFHVFEGVCVTVY